MLGNNLNAFLSSADFFQNHLFGKFFQEYDQCQTVLILVRPDKMSGLIWVQTVCKSYQQTALVGKELTSVLLSHYRSILGPTY